MLNLSGSVLQYHVLVKDDDQSRLLDLSKLGDRLENSLDRGPFDGVGLGQVKLSTLGRRGDLHGCGGNSS